MERQRISDDRQTAPPVRRPDDHRRGTCISCGQLGTLHPEAVFGGLPICEECASHVHFPSPRPPLDSR